MYSHHSLVSKEPTIPFFEKRFGSWQISIGRTAFKSSDLCHIYADKAPGWQRALHRFGIPRGYEHVLAKILTPDQRNQLGPAPVVLDCGIGTGAFASAFATVFAAPFVLDGVDASPHMLKEAEKTFKDEGAVSLHQADARRLPFPDNKFDVVLTAHMLEHMLHPQEALREMVRVLKPGGMFLACMTRSDAFGLLVQLAWRTHGINQQQATRLLGESGLDNCRRIDTSGAGLLNNLSIVCVARKPDHV